MLRLFRILLILASLGASASLHAQVRRGVIAVSSPAAGDRVAGGGKLTIAWRPPPLPHRSVAIWLVKDARLVRQIAARAPNSGNYQWAVPVTLPSGLYTIGIATADSSWVGSSGQFTIGTALMAERQAARLPDRRIVGIAERPAAQALGPDLVVSSIRLAVGQPGQSGKTVGAPVYTNSIVLIAVDARNQGNQEAVFPAGALHWKLTNAPPGVSAVGTFGSGPRIAPGDTGKGGVNFIDPGDVPAGSYTLTVMVDPDQKVSELDETNNTLSIPLTVLPAPAQPGPPDLTVRVVSMTQPATPIDGSMSLTAEVRNAGPGDAFFPGNAHVVDGPPHFDHFRTVGPFWIMAGETKQYTVPFVGSCPLTEGAFMLRVDPQSHVSESDENNNIAYDTIPVPPSPGGALPDLEVTAVSFTPAQPTTADRVMIRVDMRNSGSGPAYFCRGWTVWMSQVEGSTGGGGGAAIPARTVAPGEAFFGGLYIIEPGQKTAGTYQITATVDPRSMVAESNETNNSRTVSLTIR